MFIENLFLYCVALWHAEERPRRENPSFALLWSFRHFVSLPLLYLRPLFPVQGLLCDLSLTPFWSRPSWGLVPEISTMAIPGLPWLCVLHSVWCWVSVSPGCVEDAFWENTNHRTQLVLLFTPIHFNFFLFNIWFIFVGLLLFCSVCSVPPMANVIPWPAMSYCNRTQKLVMRPTRYEAKAHLWWLHFRDWINKVC